MDIPYILESILQLPLERQEEELKKLRFTDEEIQEMRRR